MFSLSSSKRSAAGGELKICVHLRHLWLKKQMKEIIFEVLEQPMGQGFLATAIGIGIHTEADTLEELRANVREAVDCHFDESMEPPNIIRLHFVHDELLTR